MQLCGRRLSWLLATLLLLTCGSTLAAQPERPKKVRLAIERGSLPSVLEQFSRQTGLQVITQLNVAESKTDEVGPFVGRTTPDDALTALLKGSDLTFEWQDQYTITILAKVVRAPRAEDNVDEVLVTGTRLAGIEDGPAPIRVYEQRGIDRYGISSVSDLSRYLTQQPFSFSSGQFQSGAQFFQMRGLGFDTTLVLINGRRVAASANSISLNAVDMNSIPVTAVERIEVMSDSASAIYGADAIGGVVNVILKNKIDAPQVYLHYGQAEGGGTQRRAAASLGRSTDRLKSALVLDYYEQGALMGAERDLWNDQDYRRFGGLDYRVTTTNPANIYSLTGQPLTPINRQSSLSAWSITHPSRRASAYGSAEYSFGRNFSLFGEMLATDGEVTALRPQPSILRQVVPAANPFNPFQIPVAVDYSFAGMDPLSYLSETNLLRLVGGARGSVDEWDWEITSVHSSEDGSSTSRGGINPSRVTAAANSTNPDTALNFFTQGPAGSPELLESLLAPSARFDFSFSSLQLSAFVRGPIFSIADRSADLVLGGEWRRDAATFFETEYVRVDRDIASAFTEIHLPLLDKLSLKVALRGDDYGHGEQVANPQYGLTWRPAKDWLFRAAYGTSFRPPSLYELNIPRSQIALPIADPSRGGQVSLVGLIVGGNPELEVVTARSFTAGVVFSPAGVPGLRVGGSYWEVAMDNRIMAPLYQELLRSESQYADRIIRDSPSNEDVQKGWAGRLRSISLIRVNYGDLETSGIDFDASFRLERNRTSLQFDLALTWVDDYLSRDMNQVLPSNRVGIASGQGTIPEWRTVGTITWEFARFGVSTTATFTPSYRDTDLTGPADRTINSQTLVDLQAWADLALDGDALFDGARLTLGARNVFAEAPEFAHAGGPLGYDFTQSELTQRFLYFRFSKQF